MNTAIRAMPERSGEGGTGGGGRAGPHGAEGRTESGPHHPPHALPLLDAIPVAYVTTDPAGVIIDANRRASAMLGCGRARLLGSTLASFIPAEWAEALEAHLAQVLGGREGELELCLRRTLRNRPGAEELVPVLLRSVPETRGGFDDGAVHSALVDISALKRAESRLRHARDELAVLVDHDLLTGLPSRTLFLRRLDELIARRGDDGSVHALLCVDVDRFKVINDSLGHEIGDGLIRHIARCLRGAVRHHDTVARMGGDEFTLLLNDVDSASQAGGVARKILAELGQPVQIEGHRIRPAASIGLCMFDDSAGSARELLKCADRAMYVAKQRGGHQLHFFDPEEQATHHSDIERDLQEALDHGQLRLRFQPQLSADGRVVGHEALVRWQHPRLGLVPPDRFIGIAEESGLIRDVGAWVLQEACRRNIGAFRRSGKLRRIAVNVSPRELGRKDYAAAVRRILERTGHPAHALEIEITESAMALGRAELETTLDELTALGVSIALDDFGTGYSSFARLRQLPISRLKVDRSFTQAIDESEDDRRIASAIVSLARELGLEVVAEGVETPTQMQFLRDSGCELFQGFLYSRPRVRLMSA